MSLKDDFRVFRGAEEVPEGLDGASKAT